MRKTLDLNKTYAMPKPFVVKMIDENILVISPETANWLLLKNKRQLQLFNALASGSSIKAVMNDLPQNDHQDLIYVLTELEAKQFENTIVQYPPEHGMYIYVTNKCNQRCNHCYMYAGHAFNDELNTDEIKSLLEVFASRGGKVVTLTGGEATTRIDFEDIVRFAKEQRLTVGVLSNGLLWNESLISRVKGYVDEVQISIDGFNRESYQRIRNTDSFDVAIAAVKRISSAGIRTTVAVTPLLDTLIQYENEYIEFANSIRDKYGVAVKFNTELMEGRRIAPTKEENEKYNKCVKRIKKSCAPYSELEGFAIDHRGNTLFNNCGYGGLSVNSNGDVYFCNLIQKCAKQGNIRSESFDSILMRAELCRKLSDVRNLIPCNNCDIKFLCGGGCRIKHFRDLTEKRIELNRENRTYIRRSTCTQEQKDSIYRLMISANQMFYR